MPSHADVALSNEGWRILVVIPFREPDARREVITTRSVSEVTHSVLAYASGYEKNAKRYHYPEIAAKVNSPQEILDYYFRVNPPIEIATRTTDAQVETGQTTLATSRPLHKAKVLVVGEAFDAHEDKTEGIKTHTWHVTAPIAGEEQTVRMNVWDFGGQEIMHATHQFFLTHRSLYVIVLDSRHNESPSGDRRVENDDRDPGRRTPASIAAGSRRALKTMGVTIHYRGKMDLERYRC